MPGEPGWCLLEHLSLVSWPRTLVTSYFPPEVGKQMKGEDFSDILIFKNVACCLGIRTERVVVTARAEMASNSQARLLDIKPGSPMLPTVLAYLTDKQRTIKVTISGTSSKHFVLSCEIALVGT